jgi:hypothetical protein
LGLPDAEVRRTVTWGLDTGIKSPRTAPDWHDVKNRADTCLRWLSWWEGLDQADFPKTKGTTLLRLHSGVAMVGIAVGKLDLGLSYRQWSDASGLSTATLVPLLKRGGSVEQLGHLRAIRRVRRGAVNPKTSTIWRPIAKRVSSRHPRRPDAYASDCRDDTRMGPLSSPAMNIFHRRGNAWRLAQLLDDREEVTVGELANRTGLGPAAIRDNLAYLEQHRLAERVDRTHWHGTLTRANPEMAAPDGVDHIAKRYARHVAERSAFRRTSAETLRRRERRQAEVRERAQWFDTETAGDWWSAREPVPIFDPDTGEILEGS